MAAADMERVEVRNRAELRRWLEEHQDRTTAVWLVTYKKSGARPEFHLAYSDVVDELLCFGWIDSRPAKLDADRSMLLIAPRRIGSAWSGINKRKVERLIAVDRMTEAGLARIEAAKRDGSWSRIDEAQTLQVPDDLAAALDDDPAAADNWNAFPPSSRRAILEWIATARKPQTRAARIEETVRRAALGRRANHPVDSD